MDNSEAVVKVENVSKTFKLPHDKNSTIKGSILNFWRTKKGFEVLEALKDITFDIQKGDFYGIVGRNGSGKSTLLKVLAGIYSPSKGSVTINGKIIPFIELGVGFSPELSGRDNVFLNGSLLGFSRKEMMSMYKDIVEFSELERFMDQKLKNYSSGMQVRLAFSIAIRARGDILLIDEVLAVGDEAFQQKCLNYFKQLKKEHRTVILVSHDMSSIEKHCTKALLIHDGVVKDIGHPKDISAQYKLLNLPIAAKNKDDEFLKLRGDIKIDNVTVNNVRSAVIDDHENIKIKTLFTPKTEESIIVSASISQIDGQHVAYIDSRYVTKGSKYQKGNQYEAVLEFPAKQLLKGAYQVDVDIRNKKDIYLARKSDAVQFSITSKDNAKAGIFNLQGDWEIKQN